jgi:hypothetical protein
MLGGTGQKISYAKYNILGAECCRVEVSRASHTTETVSAVRLVDQLFAKEWLIKLVGKCSSVRRYVAMAIDFVAYNLRHVQHE